MGKVRDAICGLASAGHGDARPVVDAADAAKLYVIRRAKARGIPGLIDPAWTALPTAEEFRELIELLAYWARGHGNPNAAKALFDFLAADSAPTPGKSGMYATPGVSGVYPTAAPSPWEWSARAGEADHALNWIKQQALAADECAPRPPAPTAAWCLRGGNTVRWEGEIKLKPQLYQLLDLLLSRAAPGPIPFADVEARLWGNDGAAGLKSGAVADRLSELQARLAEIKFPVVWQTKGACIVPTDD